MVSNFCCATGCVCCVCCVCDCCGELLSLFSPPSAICICFVLFVSRLSRSFPSVSFSLFVGVVGVEILDLESAVARERSSEEDKPSMYVCLSSFNFCKIELI